MTRNFAAVPWMGVAFGVALALGGATLEVVGIDAKGIRVALDLTARWSFLLFWTAYTVGPMSALFGPAFASLARRGREFGLAFASAHLVHIGLVVWLYWITGRAPLSGALFAFFMIGTIWIYLLAALSFGGLSEALGPKSWRALRFMGLNYILLAFAYDFVPAGLHAATSHQTSWRVVEYLPFAILSVAAPLLRSAGLAYRRWGVRQVAA